MIKVQDHNVEISGNMPELLAEVTQVTRRLYLHMVKADGVEIADSMLNQIIKLAKMTDDEISEKLKKLLMGEES